MQMIFMVSQASAGDIVSQASAGDTWVDQQVWLHAQIKASVQQMFLQCQLCAGNCDVDMVMINQTVSTLLS